LFAPTRRCEKAAAPIPRATRPVGPATTRKSGLRTMTTNLCLSLEDHISISIARVLAQSRPSEEPGGTSRSTERLTAMCRQGRDRCAAITARRRRRERSSRC
jgi:hypothetical protein